MSKLNVQVGDKIRVEGVVEKVNSELNPPRSERIDQLERIDD